APLLPPCAPRPHPAVAHSFFFSSRRRHTRSKRDWSSNVCSSDLAGPGPAGRRGGPAAGGDDLRHPERQGRALRHRAGLRGAGPEIGRASCREREKKTAGLWALVREKAARVVGEATALLLAGKGLP